MIIAEVTLMTIRLEKPVKLREAFTLVTEDATKVHAAFDCGMTNGNGSWFGFAGKYAVDADHILLTITKKPFIFADSTVDKEVKKYWAQICAKVK
jgi:hypothetical protein